jgi:hypothetical protein
MAQAKIKGGIDFDASSVGKGIAAANNQVEGFGKRLKKLKGAGLAAVAIGTVAAGKKISELGNELFDQARSVGIGVEAYQAFSNAVQDTGGTAENATGALSDLRQRVDEAQRGNQGAIDAFAGLGISIEDISNKSMPELLDMVAKAFVETNNFSDAAKVLGTDNLRGVNVALQDIARKGFPEMIEAQKEAGRIIREEDARTFDAFESFMKKRVDQVKAFGAFLAGETLRGLGFEATEPPPELDLGKGLEDVAAPGGKFDQELQEIWKNRGTQMGEEFNKATESKRFSNLRRIGANVLGGRGKPNVERLQEKSNEIQKDQLESFDELVEIMKNKDFDGPAEF